MAVKILEQVHTWFGFALLGYVIMPNHVHLLIGELPALPPAKIIQVFKQRVSRRMRGTRGASASQLPLRFAEGEREERRFW